MADSDKGPLQQQSVVSDPADQLLGVVRDLVVELHPERRRRLRLSLQSRLDRDLGIDSLGRTELLIRLERTLQVHLPEAVITKADTVGDLLKAVLTGKSVADTVEQEIHHPALESVEATPWEARTLTEVLDWHERRHPERLHVVLWDAPAEASRITYGYLADQARSVAGSLIRRGLTSGERTAIMLPTGSDFFSAFFGILYAGGVPVPIYPPVRPSQIEEHLRRQAAILRNADAKALITFPEARAVAGLLQGHVEDLRLVETVGGLQSADQPELPASAGEESLALLQYTSGSTGDPKGVMLSHRSLLANLRAIGHAIQVESSDVVVSWLPLYHDMGLIGMWLGSLYFATPAVTMSPLTFLARPLQWLRAIHQHGGTITAAPNFAYELCVRKIDDGALASVDLSSLRLAMNGAEPVLPQTLRRFSERFGPCGFRAEALAPVYGMAENSVGLTFPSLGRPPLTDRILRVPFTRHGEAKPASPDDATALEFVACGQPLSGHEIRVVDARGREVGERVEGRLQFRGPSATHGYFHNEVETRKLFDGDWLESGDRAYIAAGDIFLTGRSKDILIRAGRNIYPHEVEAIVGEMGGIRKGCVAVFGSADPESATERVIVVAETRETDPNALSALRTGVQEVASEVLETPPDDVVLAPPHTVPKTSSGKIRRSATRELYDRGDLAAGRRAVWWQVTRLAAGGLLRRAQRRVASILEAFYAVYWWVVGVIFSLAAWLLVAVLPAREWRWKAVHYACRAILRLTATPLEVTGQEHLPSGGAVLVVNHASYIDGYPVAAALSRPTSFVAKRELASQFFAGSVLKGIDAIFVERVDPGGSVEDTRQAIEAARSGKQLLFFPEATFIRTPGLLSFRLGAFVVAAEAGVPVVPVTLRGTRSILRELQWFPRRGSVQVRISAPIFPQGSGFAAAVQLRDAARAEILAHCNEPDLADERAFFSPEGIEQVRPDSD